MYWHQQTWISTLIIFNARHPRGDHKVNTRKLNVKLILVVSRSLSLTPTPITTFSDFPAKCAFFFSFYVCSFLRSSIRVSICLSTCQSLCLPSERLSVSPFVHLSVCCTSVCLLCLSAVWVPICLSIYPFVCLLSEEVGFLYVGKTLTIRNYTVSWPSLTPLTNRDSKSSVFVAI